MNAKKTQVMAFNLDGVKVNTLGGVKLDVVKDFKYLSGWIASTAKDIKIRSALAWSALHGMKIIGESDMDRKLKRCDAFSSPRLTVYSYMDVRDGCCLCRMRRP